MTKIAAQYNVFHIKILIYPRNILISSHHRQVTHHAKKADSRRTKSAAAVSP